MKLLVRVISLATATIIWTSCGKGVGAGNGADAPPNTSGTSDSDGGPTGVNGNGGVDAGPIQPSTTATLLEPGATIILGVSPDGTRVLVSHQPLRWPPDDLSLVTAGQRSQTLVAHGAYYAGFSPDGRTLWFDTAKGQQPDDLNLARADGSNARQLTSRTYFFTFAGKWLYYSDEAGSDVSFYRLAPPDGTPELLATFPPPHISWGPLSAWPSPDGESVVYCHTRVLAPVASECFLRAAGRETPLQLPAGIEISPYWAPDGSWFTISPCALVDLAGTVRKVCDDATVAGTSMSPDGKLLGIASNLGPWPGTQQSLRFHIYTIATATDLALPAPGLFDLTIYRPAFGLSFTPDGSRLIATLGASSFGASTSGGDWTTISKDEIPAPQRGNVVVSPDSRVIADASDSLGVVESIDGGPSRAVGPPGITFPSGTSTPIFEPLGGLDKALFVAPRTYGGETWIANADGSAGWLRLPDADGCEWSVRTALCAKIRPDPLTVVSNDLTVATDDGKKVETVAYNVEHWLVTRRKLFYVPSAGGLYVLDVPQP
jgi:hypothetical protein